MLSKVRGLPSMYFLLRRNTGRPKVDRGAVRRSKAMNILACGVLCVPVMPLLFVLGKETACLCGVAMAVFLGIEKGKTVE